VIQNTNHIKSYRSKLFYRIFKYLLGGRIMEAIIHYKEPAKQWSQGCLLGNGFMGEVIYGGIDKEIIALSEASFFSGADEEVYQENSAYYFEKMRKEAIKQNHGAVKELTKQFMGKRGNYGTNLPVGQLEILFDKQELSGEYTRNLDLNKGLCSIQYEVKENLIRREAFSSYMDKVFCYQIRNASKEGISFSLRFTGKDETSHVYKQEERMCFTCNALEELHSDGSTGVSLMGVIHVCLTDGEIVYHNNYIKVTNTHEAVIYLAMETNFSLEKEKTMILDFDELYHRTNFKVEDYKALRKRHVSDFESYMNRQYINLKQDEKTSLMHQFGRYLLLSSSREKSKLPAHLQGVWNDNVACNIGWTCDMHLDINTQMNYWISESGNLCECHTPLFEWLEKRSIPNGRRTAQVCYGRKGWVLELVSNAWGYAAPYWNESLSPCPASGIWTTSDYMEHYRFTSNIEFLHNHVYPVLKEAVTFFCDYIFENEEGYYVAGPSISPENAFIVEGEKYYASIGGTFEILMIRELFKDYVEVMKILKKEDEMTTFVKRALPKLLPYKVDEQGRIKEWNHEFSAQDLQHRHTSHLLGLFPYHQINPKDTPKLAKAAQLTMEAKLKPEKNWEDTGWARNLIILYYARLQNKEMAYKNVKALQQNLTNQGLLVMHPPTRGAYSFADVYELDGNTGFSMAVVEMLVQCFDDVIELFPATPKEWKDGCAKGILLRGGICIHMEWDMSSSITIELQSNTNKTINLKYHEWSKVVELKENKIEKITIIS
jgi:alpha-L-fucosidase 2